ncbi:hypothetical protein VTI74DRAFT_1719 [Chaetomium olivicolor]
MLSSKRLFTATMACRWPATSTTPRSGRSTSHTIPKSPSCVKPDMATFFRWPTGSSSSTTTTCLSICPSLMMIDTSSRRSAKRTQTGRAFFIRPRRTASSCPTAGSPSPS